MLPFEIDTALPIGPYSRVQEVFSFQPLIPFPVGQKWDLITRTLGDRLSDQMKQPVIVENMPGANAGLAAGSVARSAPDGYTLFMAVDSNLVVNPTLYSNLTYDPFRDFAPISVIAKLHMVMVANPKCPPRLVDQNTCDTPVLSAVNPLIVIGDAVAATGNGGDGEVRNTSGGLMPGSNSKSKTPRPTVAV